MSFDNSFSICLFAQLNIEFPWVLTANFPLVTHFWEVKNVSLRECLLYMMLFCVPTITSYQLSWLTRRADLPESYLWVIWVKNWYTIQRKADRAKVGVRECWGVARFLHRIQGNFVACEVWNLQHNFWLILIWYKLKPVTA